MADQDIRGLYREMRRETQREVTEGVTEMVLLRALALLGDSYPGHDEFVSAVLGDRASVKQAVRMALLADYAALIAALTNVVQNHDELVDTLATTLSQMVEDQLKEAA